MNKQKSKIEWLFHNDLNVVGIVGDRNSGKTNNLISLIKEFREYNEKTPIYIYGFDYQIVGYLKKFPNITIITSLSDTNRKNNSLFIFDEFQKLGLTDPHQKDKLEEFVNSLARRNNNLILSSPDLRHFNNQICSIIQIWGVKTLDINDLINGTTLKKKINNYRGCGKECGYIETKQNELILLNVGEEKILKFDYIEEVDLKKDHQKIK